MEKLCGQLLSSSENASIQLLSDECRGVISASTLLTGAQILDHSVAEQLVQVVDSRFQLAGVENFYGISDEVALQELVRAVQGAIEATKKRMSESRKSTWPVTHSSRSVWTSLPGRNLC